MRKLAVALNVSYDYLANDEVTDPKQGIEKIEHIESVRGQFGDRAALEVDELLERNAALFAGGELSEEAKDAFFTLSPRHTWNAKRKQERPSGAKRNKSVF